MVSLFAFILVLGVVVDDAIVVGENIYTRMEEGMAPLQAAIVGLRDILPPVIIGIVTTMMAFAPLLLVTGIMGQMLYAIPVVVISVLLFSLVEAMLILPSHLSRIKPSVEEGPLERIQAKLRGRLEVFIRNVYRPMLRYTLNKPFVIVASGIALLMLTMGILAGGHLKFVFIEGSEGEIMVVNLKMPVGTPFDETKKNMYRILDAFEQTRIEVDDKKDYPDGVSVFENIATFVGTTPFAANIAAASDSTVQSHVGQINVQLLPAERRDVEVLEIERSVRGYLGELPGAELVYTYDQFNVGSDIAVEVSLDDPELLLEVVERLKIEISKFPGTLEIADSFDIGKRELNLELTDAGLASGLTLGNLARQVRQAFYGEEVQRIQRGRDEVKVLVRYPDAERREISSIYDMRVRLDSGVEVPFRSVARVTEGRGYSTIERTDRRQVITVTAKVDNSSGNAVEINETLRDSVLPVLATEFQGLIYNMEGEEAERTESFSSMFQAMAFAILIIFSILSVQLRSYTQPLIIMSAIPFGFVGAIFGHLILGFNVSMVSTMGLIALTGVVINDSLILMDKINKTREYEPAVDEAIIYAASRRFRPILFTTLTTFVGLAPMIFETSTNARFMIPMAISLAFGIVFATTITLLLVPALYKIRYNFMQWARERRDRGLQMVSGKDDWADEWDIE
jgi:multidrug efflux pump subunit AcrB